MQTDPEINNAVIRLLSALYTVISTTEGDPLENLGVVYETTGKDGNKVQLVLTGYSDSLALEGYPNGAMAPVITRYFVLQTLDQETKKVQDHTWLLNLPKLQAWTKTEERIAVPEPKVATPTFVVRRNVMTTDTNEVDETSFFNDVLS